MSIQRRKTEMVGSLVIPVDCLTNAAAAAAATSTTTTDEASSITRSTSPPNSPGSLTRDVLVYTAAETVQHLGQDLKRSVNLKKRHTEMYGTLIVDTLNQETTTTTSPSSPLPTSPSSSRRTKNLSKWNEPLDEEVAEGLQHVLCI